MGTKTGLFGPMKTLGSARHGIERTDDGRLRAWILHNVEESGETEKFVPQLYAHARECLGA